MTSDSMAKDASFIGGELVRLINETSERIGYTPFYVASLIRQRTGVMFTLADGKLNITEEQLHMIGRHLGDIAEYCSVMVPSPIGTENRSGDVVPAPPEIEKPVASADVQLRSPSQAPREHRQRPPAKRSPNSFFEEVWEHPILLVMCFILALVAMASFNARNSRSPSSLERAEVKARTGRATEMTDAEADAFRRKQESDAAAHKTTVTVAEESRRAQFSDRDRAIYRYMRTRFERLGDGYNPDVHDAMIANEVASRFDVSPDEALQIYIKLDN